MFALVGILVSCAALIGTAQAADLGASGAVDQVHAQALHAQAFDDACTLGGPACEALVEAAEPAIYATPAEVDCPAPGDRAPTRLINPAAARPVAEDCSPPSIDFRYRVSRSPESERPPGALRPQRTRRNVRVIAACTGLPIQRGTSLAPSAVQPIAMYAVLELRPPAAETAAFEWFARGPTRALEPLDRPPRSRADRGPF